MLYAVSFRHSDNYDNDDDDDDDDDKNNNNNGKNDDDTNKTNVNIMTTTVIVTIMRKVMILMRKMTMTTISSGDRTRLPLESSVTELLGVRAASPVYTASVLIRELYL